MVHRLTPMVIAAALGLMCSVPVSAQDVAAADAALQAQMVEELNFARTRPQAYVERLLAYRPTIQGRYAVRTVDGPNGPYSLRTRTAEGVAAVDKAIAFLQAQAPIGRLASDPALLEAARRFAEEQAETGKWGHTSADGRSLTDRIAQDQTRHIHNAETIMYGASTAPEIVMHLIIDDGVPDRGHRDVIFDNRLTLVGTVCRPNPKWNICVSEYASDDPVRVQPRR